MSLMLGTAWVVSMIQMPSEYWMGYLAISLVVMVFICFTIQLTSGEDEDGELQYERNFLFRLIEPVLKWVSIGFLFALCVAIFLFIAAIIISIGMLLFG